MKITFSCVLFLMSLCLYSKENDSFIYKGYVFTKENYSVMPSIKGANITIKYHKQVLGFTQSNQFGYFELKLPQFDTIEIEVAARDQPMITYDSICPYYVYKTPRGYFDCYTTKFLYHHPGIVIDTFKLLSPLICERGMIFFDQAKYFDEPVVCDCLKKQFALIDTIKLVPTIKLLYYYANDEENAYNFQKAMTIKLKLSTEYLIPEKYIIIDSSYSKPKDYNGRTYNNEITVHISVNWR